MTEAELFALVENLEDAAIEFAEAQYSEYRSLSTVNAARQDLRDARADLKAAIMKLYEGKQQ